MIRFLFRLMATVSLAVATVMAVLDATRTVAAGSWVMTPLGESWKTVSPDTLTKAQATVETLLLPALWDPVALFILKLPGFVVFGVLALLLYAIGRKPARRLDPFAQRA
ncbi:hypothetical protein SAZ10_27515 [Mesorhizobium sp. BAC0120]|uniref:hypothetical protein n=1 Tax=Mesorhizobium sp. BAC0120 TaxID=3090670 RepID=UPI00298BE614|nr:hypothetical protein [Mesorhizobium sp. BAC0120]MDW6025517.1 hypothetical protein [Mesorhizobium sp. BAC0120]